MSSKYEADKSMKFTFGLWTVGNVGRDPFGEAVRERMEPWQIVDFLGKVGGVYGVNFHDNDLIPIDATADETSAIKRDFRKALRNNGLKVPMATTNLFTEPMFRDGAFTSNDARVRAQAIVKVMKAMELGHEFGARMFVFWGGREGVETDAAKDPIEAIKRLREAMNFLCEYSISQGYKYRFALEAKANEPRGHIYNAVTGSYLAFIETLDHSEMWGVNPEVAHEHMAGLNFVHQVAAAMEVGKLFHIDLNDQEFGRFDQDYRFGSVNLKHAFFLVKLLEDYGYNGLRHFDAHAYRTSNYNDVKSFAAGCIRTYMILKEKAERWNKDREIQGILRKVNREDKKLARLTKKFTKAKGETLLGMDFDRKKLAKADMPYEKLDQLTMEVIMGVR